MYLTLSVLRIYEWAAGCVHSGSVGAARSPPVDAVGGVSADASALLSELSLVVPSTGFADT